MILARHTARGYLPGLKRTSRSTQGPCKGYFSKLHTRLYALSQATFFADPKLGAWPLWRGLRCPYLLHETFLAAQGPQDGPDQPRQHEGCSTKDLMVIRCAAAVRPARRQLLRSEW